MGRINTVKSLHQPKRSKASIQSLSKFQWLFSDIYISIYQEYILREREREKDLHILKTSNSQNNPEKKNKAEINKDYITNHQGNAYQTHNEILLHNC